MRLAVRSVLLPSVLLILSTMLASSGCASAPCTAPAVALQPPGMRVSPLHPRPGRGMGELAVFRCADGLGRRVPAMPTSGLLHVSRRRQRG